MVKNRVPNFEMNPYIVVKNEVSHVGCEAIVKEIKEKLACRKGKVIITFDYYHGVNEKQIYEQIIQELHPDLCIDTDTIKYPESIIGEKFHEFITDDRTNGVFCTCHMDDFFDPAFIEEARETIQRMSSGLIVVYGVGASIVYEGDILMYVGITSEDILERYKRGMDNWGAKNFDEEFLRKEKRFVFLERRVQDWHKGHVLEKMDYYIDAHDDDHYVMISKDTYFHVMKQFANQPFKCVPYFTEGVWGGHWAQEMLGAGKHLKNVAWAVQASLNQNSIQAEVGGQIIRFQATDISFTYPIEFLGGQVYFMSGTRFPFSIDYLDTMGGQNLSLQCHPTIDYNQEHFNCATGHFESYYILEDSGHSAVYLGTKDGVKKDDLVNAFQEAQKTGHFDDEKYINKFPVKKHDHVFIPSGTIHASAADTVVLEINTYSNSTFKLWDWGRVDLDGKPRPINIEHGKHVIQEKYQTSYVKEHLISKKVTVATGDGWRKEHSGLMEFEPLRVERYFIKKGKHFESENTVKVLTLVENEEAVIESPTNAFEPVVIHYAESVFLPANVGQFYVRPYGKSEAEQIGIVETYINYGNKE